jgi:hypothetical protein
MAFSVPSLKAIEEVGLLRFMPKDVMIRTITMLSVYGVFALLGISLLMWFCSIKKYLSYSWLKAIDFSITALAILIILANIVLLVNNIFHVSYLI